MDLKQDEDRAAGFIQSIDDLTNATNTVQGPARNIDSTNGALFTSGQGPIAQVNSALKGMTLSAKRSLRKTQGAEKFKEKEAQQSILSTYKEFITSHTETCNTLTSKVGTIVTTAPSAKLAVRQALAELAASIDLFSQALQQLVPNVGNEFAAEHKKLTAMMRATVLRFA